MSNLDNLSKKFCKVLFLCRHNYEYFYCLKVKIVKELEQIKAQLEEKNLQYEQKIEELLNSQNELRQQLAAGTHQIEKNEIQTKEYQEMISQLEALLRETEVQMEELQAKHTQHNNAVEADFKNEKLRLEQKLEVLVQLKEVRTFQGTC